MEKAPRKKAPKPKATFFMEVTIDEQYLGSSMEELQSLVGSAKGFGDVIRSELVVPSETIIKIDD